MDNLDGYTAPTTKCVDASGNGGVLNDANTGNTVIFNSAGSPAGLQPGFRCSNDFTSKDLAVMACPTPASKCGPHKVLQVNNQDATTVNTTKV